MKLSADNFTFSLKETISSICENFFKSLGLSYFQFLRCYHDGSVGLLTNDTRLYELFQLASNKPVVYSSFTDLHEKNYQYWFMWDEALPHYPVSLAKNFNIHHGITLVRRQKHYYDMIAVALPKKIDDPASFYLNKLTHIENFIINFEKQHFQLIHQMDAERLDLPESLRDTNYRQ